MASNKKKIANKEPVARYVDFDLTDADVEDLRRENTERTSRLVTARQQQGDLKKEKKYVVEQLDIHKRHQEAKRLADELDLEVQETVKAIGAKKQTRLVDCYWHYRPSDGLLTLIHEESGREIERRFATADEREFWAQEGLGFDEEGVH